MMPDVFRMIVGGVSILTFVALSAMYLVWMERKVSALFQNRLGPMIVGWQGSLQTAADMIKLLLKENIVPSGVDKISWWLAPFFVVVPPVMAFVCMPFGKNLIVRDLNVGVLYLTSVTSVCVLGIFMAGWGSNNKYSLLGGIYQIPAFWRVFDISGCRESNSDYNHPMVAYYHYTTARYRFGYCFPSSAISRTPTPDAPLERNSESLAVMRGAMSRWAKRVLPANCSKNFAPCDAPP